jgi:hypothetical protein
MLSAHSAPPPPPGSTDSAKDLVIVGDGNEGEEGNEGDKGGQGGAASQGEGGAHSGIARHCAEDTCLPCNLAPGA